MNWLTMVSCIVMAWLIIKLIGLIAGAITVLCAVVLAAVLAWWHLRKLRKKKGS
jgi:predicted cation transporter